MAAYEIIGIVVKPQSVSSFSGNVLVQPSYTMAQHAAEGWLPFACDSNVMWFRRLAKTFKPETGMDEAQVGYGNPKWLGTCDACGGDMISTHDHDDDPAYQDFGKQTHTAVKCSACGRIAPPVSIVPLITMEEFQQRRAAREQLYIYPGTGIMCSTCRDGELVETSPNRVLGGKALLVCRKCGAQDQLVVWGDK